MVVKGVPEHLRSDNVLTREGKLERREDPLASRMGCA
jgi:hypothetical protein